MITKGKGHWIKAKKKKKSWKNKKKKKLTIIKMKTLRDEAEQSD